MGRKRINKSDVGTRFERALNIRFGSVKDAASHYHITVPAFNDYIAGRTQPGLKWQLRLESEGINFAWVKTGKGEMLLASPRIQSGTEYAKVDQIQKELMQVKEELRFYKGKSEALEKTLAPHIVQTVMEGLATGVRRRKKK